MVEEYFDRLPSEILHNIALMLPFSSIIQLKYSSKFWYNLLTDPKFVDLHLTHALEKPPGFLFYAIPKLWSDKNACYFVEESGGHVSTSKIFEYSFEKNEADLLEGFQSGGGLMCAYSSRYCSFRIFNPHIGEEVQVPYNHKFKIWYVLRCMFSYSPLSKEYKILKLGRTTCCPQSTVAEICTLGSNIWRKIQNVPNNLWYIYPYTQCQGYLFWVVGSDLYFFDIFSENFHIIPGPPVLDLINMMHECLISMSDTVGYVHNNNRLWVLEDKRKGIWINRYDLSIPGLYQSAMLIGGTSENGHLLCYNDYPTINFFSHDMGCTGFKVMENKLDEYGSEELSRIKYLDYIAPHVRSFVSPIRIMNMEKRLNHKRKRVLDTLKLDYDATEY